MTTITRPRRVAVAAAAMMGLSLVTPAAAHAAPTAAAASAVAHATPSVPADHPNGRMGVWANIHNRSNTDTITVKNRRSGVHYDIKPRQSYAFDRDFVTACDEIELTVEIPGQEDFDIDIANPTFSWPNVTVAGDNENFAEWDTKYFVAGESRVEVQRHDDQNDRKRFFLNITPPGPLQQAQR